MVNKRVWSAILGCNLKNDRIISAPFQGKPFNITEIQVYAPTTDAEEAEVDWFYVDLRYLVDLTHTKNQYIYIYILFIIEDWNAKVGSQEIPRKKGKFGLGVQNETVHTGHSKHPLPTTQEMTLHMDMDITRESLKSDSLCSLQPKMEKHYTVMKNKTWSWLWIRSWAPYCKIKVYIKENGENH